MQNFYMPDRHDAMRRLAIAAGAANRTQNLGVA